MIDYTPVRLNMVESQLRTNRVTDPGLIEAFEQVPRELFLPEALRSVAYVDKDLAIAEGRHMMEPRVLARLLQVAGPGPEDVVLDIGCGTGYATALLARLSATVVALECDAGLAGRANDILQELEVGNAIVVEGPLNQGHARQAPYNVILLNGGVAEVPPAISGQLADGGRLVAVVRDAGGLGRATLVQRNGQVISGRVLFDASIPLLPGFEVEPGFVF
ncbi:MAG: protein-L-isoaspartate O-methyltransferase [Kiloniellales bacterium]|jgi:protein-L-isoaspartate(D-aspartate) O-methyltransferase